jgi:hypothetical protein
MRPWLRSVIGAGLALAIAAPATAEVSELRITKQPSIIYLPLVVMEQNKLLEKARESGRAGRSEGFVDHLQQRRRVDRCAAFGKRRPGD